MAGRAETDDHMNPGIPVEVATFVQASFSSLEEFELLTLLQARPDQSWTPEVLARELGSTPASIARRLAGFADLGIIALQPAPGAPTIAYAPATPALAELLRAVAHAYRQRRIAMVALIYERPRDSLRLFSDAFRLRKDPPA